MSELRAIIIDVIDPSKHREEAEKDCAEMVRLVDTLQGIVVVKIIQKRGRPSASTFLGTGKTEEVATLVQQLHIDVVICNQILKPTQINNLQQIIPCSVWDRVDVILQIFERHAHTQEAKLQVQLARLKNEFPRLYGKGIELSQIVGGKKGYTRGPGEKLLEQRKRHLRRQIDQVEKKIAGLKQVRATQREQRQRKNFISLALVGYTNSGKSSLLVALTKKKNIYIADELFATLDTRIGHLYFPQIKKKAIISDTIGFIQHLPPQLISSFLATLEETRYADILLHVIDASTPDIGQHLATVHEILQELGCNEKPVIYVLNKCDLLSQEQRERIQKEFYALHPLLISAKTKEGLELLKTKIQKLCNKLFPHLY
jgi:GTP-binding protein HflX